MGGGYAEVTRLLLKMQEDVSPNSSTIVGVLPMVAQAKALSHGKEMHGYCIRKGYSNGVVAGTGFLDMYAKCQCISYARRIFDMMGVFKNEVTWSAMIGGYVACDLMEEGLDLFRRLLSVKDESGTYPTEATLSTAVRACAKLIDFITGKCLHGYILKTGAVFDKMVGNTLLSMYAKCGVIDDASSFFDEMLLKDAVTYAAIISGYVQNGYAEEALQMFYKLQWSGVEPDVSTMTGILPACSHLAALQHGYCSHSYAIVHGFASRTIVCNALIDMYAKCGKIYTARKVFDTMDVRDLISWNSMIDAYGIHGLGKDALSLFEEMQVEGTMPDDVTFICLLSACGHSGLVAEGKKWFSSMTQDFGIKPRMDHYICMTDLLSRAGLLDEVRKFIQDMPFKPDVRIWGSVLASCKIHKNIELGEQVSKEIERLGPESTGNFVLLSNMYSTIGRWDDAAQVRLTQKEMGFRKSPGCSWIEVGGNVHTFVGGDRSHPESQQINKKLDELLVEMKKLGYSAESSFVFHDVEEEEKDKILLYHSEKLAIAFGMLRLSPSKPILVTKNLRVCGDCHNAIKLISLIAKRDITVRDASRFHHFKDGNCNCGDFW
ncbi:Pentatricopeptide repeat-containing protein At1g11290, chloroplastic [Linum grandiflorum]